MIIALVCGGTLNSSAANLRTVVKGAASGTLNLKSTKSEILKKELKIEAWKGKEEGEGKRRTYTLKGNLGSEVRVTLKETFPPPAIFSLPTLDALCSSESAK